MLPFLLMLSTPACKKDGPEIVTPPVVHKTFTNPVFEGADPWVYQQDSTQRTWVLENTAADPTHGAWVDKGKSYSPAYDRWAIDGTVLDHGGSRYFLWSGRPDLSVQNQFFLNILYWW